MAGKCLTVMTFNLWGDNYWSCRREAVRTLLTTRRPDILCVQEFSKEAEDLLTGCAAESRACQSNKRRGLERPVFPGWESEGNIYWNKDLLKLAKGASGAPDIGADEVAIHKREKPTQKHRRLFWVRLKLNGSDRTVFVSTAQLTFKGSAADEAGRNPRKKETRRIIRVLKSRILKDERGEPTEQSAFFMGDVNDTSPFFDLSREGFKDCFTCLGTIIPPTVPVYPKGPDIGKEPGEDLLRSLSSDCITANIRAKPREAKVRRFWHRAVAPSDHLACLGCIRTGLKVQYGACETHHLAVGTSNPRGRVSRPSGLQSVAVLMEAM